MTPTKSLFSPQELAKDPRLGAVADSHDRWRLVATRLSYLNTETHLHYLQVSAREATQSIIHVNSAISAVRSLRIWIPWFGVMFAMADMSAGGVVFSVLSMLFYAAFTYLSYLRDEERDTLYRRRNNLLVAIDDVKVDLQNHPYHAISAPTFNSIPS